MTGEEITTEPTPITTEPTPITTEPTPITTETALDIGVHILLNVSNIIEDKKISYVMPVIELLDIIVEKFTLNVINKSVHQFTPIGVTAVYVLAESHLSIHTFPEKNAVSMDLFTCGKRPDIETLVNIIKESYTDCIVDYNIINR